MEHQSEIRSSIRHHQSLLIDLSDRVWELAETKFEEYKTSALYCDTLRKLGFEVETGIGGLPTAFKGSFGKVGPTIGFLGEFDALPNLDQQAGIYEKKPTGRASGNGHGCGHNLLGTGSLAAALSLKEQIEKGAVSGRVVFYGCPAEEGGSGKAWMVREHCFDECDALLTWHPYPHNSILGEVFLASIQAVFSFDGTAAHAAACPHLGRSALDALELMNVGVQFLREHIIPEARVHYAILDGGGAFANVVQPHAEVLYQIRAPKMKDVTAIYERVQNIAKGAALMTDTTVSVRFDRCSSEIRPNNTLDDLLYEEFTAAGPVPVDEQDRQFARSIRATLAPEMLGSNEESLCRHYGSAGAAIAELIADEPVINQLSPRHALSYECCGSSDVGDVSQVRPTAEISTACFAKDTPAHSWQLAAQGKMPLAHKAMLHTGLVLGSAGFRLLSEPELLARVKAEFEERSQKEPYLWPIPKDAKPPLPKR